MIRSANRSPLAHARSYDEQQNGWRSSTRWRSQRPTGIGF